LVRGVSLIGWGVIGLVVRVKLQVLPPVPDKAAVKQVRELLQAGRWRAILRGLEEEEEKELREDT